MATRQYIGARYVPKFYTNSVDGSTQWESNVVYEPLTYVTLTNAHMYISKKQVPATVGSPASNADYWLDIGNYNGFIDELQEQINTINSTIGSLSDLSPNDANSIVGAIKNISYFVTPQMFGAIGNGVADDTTALQNCVDFAFANKMKVFIPSGTYNFTALSITAGTFGADGFITDIGGADRNTTILNHTGNGTAISVVYETSGTYGDGLKIHDVFVQGNSNTTVLLDLCKGTNFNVYDMRLTQSTTAGIRSTDNLWVSSFKRIRISRCATGVELSGNSVTSITLDEIYVLYATVYAYNLRGSYSNIGTLCADYCSGEYVYNFYWFNGGADSLACELADVTKGLIKFDTCSLNISEFLSVKATIDNAGVAPFFLAGSQITINSAILTVENDTTTAMPLASLYNSVFSLFTYERSNIVYGNVVDRASNSSLFIYKGVQKIPYSNRAFVGINKSLPANIQKDVFEGGVTIYTDCAGAPKYTADGTNNEYKTPTKIGDWFIENKPDVNYAGAYVMLGDCTGYVTPVDYCFVPIVKSGATADRPTIAPVGAYYFDTTLSKPIWKTSTGWVDATGTSV